MSQLANRLPAVAPGIIAGLYVGRVLSELWAYSRGQTAWWLAAGITLLAVLLCSRLLRRFNLRPAWPLLFLAIYVIYPRFDLLVAALVALFVFLTWWQTAVGLTYAGGGRASLLLSITFLTAVILLYWHTLSPGVLPADSGEFQLVATNLGIAHPPGFPLYTLLAHLATRLPLGQTPAYRVNFFSALTSTAALAAIYAGIYHLTRRHLPAVAAALLLATATTFWAQATTANIRSMTALFAAFILLSLAYFYRATILAADRPAADRALTFFALFLALGVTHHASLAFLGAVAILFLLLVEPALWRSPRRWRRPIFASLLGLLPLLYLPLRATAPIRGADPALATLPGFLEHVLALGFRGDLFVYLEPAELWQRLRIMGNILTFQFSPWLLLPLLLALLLLLRQEWRLALLYGGSALLFTLVSATYRAPQTVEYMLPAYVALALLLGVGAGGLANGAERSAFPLRALLTAFALVLALGQLTDRYASYRQWSSTFATRDYTDEVLELAPSNALLLANWHWATPLWYAQEVEGARPDVEVRYVFPTGEPYGKTWARRVGEGLNEGRDVIATNFDQEAFAELPPAEPLSQAFLYRQDPLERLPEGFAPLDLTLGDRIQVLGYRLEQGAWPLAETRALTLAWRPASRLDPATVLFAHLVGPDGRLAAQNDLPARARETGITMTRFYLTPFAGTLPGAYTLHIGAYDASPLLAPDGASRTPVEMIDLQPAVHRPPTQNPLRRPRGDNGPRLVGYDWDHTLPGLPRLYLHWRDARGYVSEVAAGRPPQLPAYLGPWGLVSNRWGALAPAVAGHYVPLGQGIAWTGQDGLPTNLTPGQQLVLGQHFLSGSPVQSDLVVSQRLIGYEEDGFHWAWWDLDDAIPAMGAIPTLKWIAGSQVRSPHFLSVHEAAEPGQQLGGALTLYDAFTGRVLPLLDDRLADDYGWIPLPPTVVGQ